MKSGHDAARRADAVKRFVERRLDVEEFVLCLAPTQASGFAGHEGPSSGDALDSIRSLCEAYSCALPDHCGYRVSEEQFRADVHRLATASGLLEGSVPSAVAPKA